MTDVETHLFWKRKREIQEGPEEMRIRPAAISELEIEEIRARKIDDLESPRKRPRRNSDSDLYRKTRDDQMKEREVDQERFLGEEKYAFVQKYLENIHEAYSITTLTSDSGIETHGAPSELGTGDISGDTHTVFFKDLSEEVISVMGTRIQANYHAMRCILQSFGIPGHFLGKFRDIFHLFPNTSVKLLRDVCEALQLYDLRDLLEKPIPRVTKSLRPVLTLDEVRKLGKIGARPISYHSRAAVLIFANSEDYSGAKSCETFFKSLNNKSEVNIIQCGDRLKLAREWEHIKGSSLIAAEAELQRLNHIIEKVKQGERWQQVEQQTETMKLTRELQIQRQTVKQLEKELKEIEGKARKEKENVETAASEVIDRWIQRQDEFSFFALFNFSSAPLSYGVIRKLCSGTPNKTKLVVAGMWPSGELSEVLWVTVPSSLIRPFPTLLLDILNKRWQTLDLVSMMDELKRLAIHEMAGWNSLLAERLVTIQDTLSSLPRFKREEDLG